MSDNPTVIYAARTMQEAHLLRNLLAEAGIQAVVGNDVLEGGAGVDVLGWRTSSRVMVHEADAASARQIALEFDRKVSEEADAEPRERATAEEPAAGLTSRLVVDWPTCPVCSARRTTQCPCCGTSGTDFAMADRTPSTENVLAQDSPAAPGGPAAPSAVPELQGLQSQGPSCGPCGCTLPGGEKAECPPAGTETPSERPMLLCPTCDEPFAPRYLRRCEWCGHDFGEGLESPATVESDEGLNVRVAVVALGLAAMAVGLVAYLMSLF